MRRAFPLAVLLAVCASLSARADLTDTCWSLVYRQPAAGLTEADRVIAATNAAHDDIHRADAHLCRGAALEQLGRPTEAQQEYEFGISEGTRLHYDPLVAAGLRLRGELRYYRGLMNDALADLQRSYRLYTALQRAKEARSALESIANVYADARVGDFDRAIEYYEQILRENPSPSDEELSTGYFNIASTMERKGDLKGALVEYQRGLEIDRKRREPGEVAVDQRAIASLLGRLGRPAEGLRYVNAALGYFEQQHAVETAAQAHLTRGGLLRRLGRWSAALDDLEIARKRFEETKNARFLEKTQEERSLAFAGAGRWQEAFEAQAAQMALRGELEEKLKEEQTARLRVQFDSEKKEQENRALLRENELRDQALRAATRVRQLQTIAIILGTLVIAALAYLVVKHIANANRLRVMAMTDELTKLPNRRHVLMVAADSVAFARQHAMPLSLLMLDIDLFKRINDRFGHDTGDAVLRRVADAGRASLRRREDVMGRTGGEEFIVVLPRTDAQAALDVAERLRASVEAIDCSDLHPELRVTISIGIAAWTSGEAVDALLKRADELLYRAKERGRNRVEMDLAFA